MITYREKGARAKKKLETLLLDKRYGSLVDKVVSATDTTKRRRDIKLTVDVCY